MQGKILKLFSGPAKLCPSLWISSCEFPLSNLTIDSLSYIYSSFGPVMGNESFDFVDRFNTQMVLAPPFALSFEQFKIDKVDCNTDGSFAATDSCVVDCSSCGLGQWFMISKSVSSVCVETTDSMGLDPNGGVLSFVFNKRTSISNCTLSH